jgi:hypothetical protein
MTKQEIAKRIQDYYNFIKCPTIVEVKSILEKINNYTTQEDLDKIILNIVSETLTYGNESLDMSATIDILEQIKKYLKDL